MRKGLRITSLIMFIIAVIFVGCALSAPNLGGRFYIGSVEITVDMLQTFYCIYVITMVMLFVASFFVKKNK